MTREAVERIDQQGIAAWDGHDVDGFVGLFADDFTWTDLTLPEPMRTTEQARQYMQGWFTAFPDMRVTQTNRVVGDDAVAAELEFTGHQHRPDADGRRGGPANRQARGRQRRLLRPGQPGRPDRAVQLTSAHRWSDDAAGD
jgi:hypothetical protein